MMEKLLMRIFANGQDPVIRKGAYATVQMLQSLLPWLDRQGYRCAAVSELSQKRETLF